MLLIQSFYSGNLQLLQELHGKAWEIVGKYIRTNLRFFTGRAIDAESTILPAVSTWISEALGEIPEVKESSDHGVVLWCNLPTCGVLSAAKHDFVITSIANLLSQFRRNSCAVLLHPNRAGQPPDRTHGITVSLQPFHPQVYYLIL